MASGPDFLLDSLLRLAGVDVEKAKAEILGLGKKFHEQDTMLHTMVHNQETILAQQALIMQRLNISTGEDHDGHVNGEHLAFPRRTVIG